MPLVSIIIPAYNAERFIRQTIDSVLAQTVRDLEIILVDDGSNDETATVVKKIADSRVKYFYQKNASQAVARNKGLSLAQGTFIAFLDADDLWPPQKLERQLPLFDQTAVGFTYTGAVFVDIEGNVGRPLPGKMRRGNITEPLLQGNFIPCSSVIIRQTLLKQTKIKFREKIQGVEDYDLWLRLSLHTRCDFEPAPLLYYRLHPGNFSAQMEKMSERTIQVQSDFVDDLQRSDVVAEQLRSLRSAAILGQRLTRIRLVHQLLAAGDRSGAKRQARQAIKHAPWHGRAWWAWLKTYLAPMYHAEK